MAILGNLMSFFGPERSKVITGSLQKGKTATGTVQADAFLLSDHTEFSTTASGTGARLPAVGSRFGDGTVIWVVNNGANTLKVYPPTGGKINNGTANASINLATLTNAAFMSDGAGNWYKLGG